MTDRDRLVELLKAAGENNGKFGTDKVSLGFIPKHYKRISLSEDEQKRLAALGVTRIVGAFGDKLYYTQAVIAGAVLSGDYDKIAVITPSQYGKLLANETLVLTRDGWKQHGNLRVGDEVISPSGDFVKVLYVHPKGYANRCVTLQTGDKFYCHENHEWQVMDRNSHKIRVLTTADMERRLLDMHGRSNFLIPPREPVKGEHKRLAVDPYVFGVWLGDGSTRGGKMCSHPEDIAVLEACRELYPEGSAWMHKDTGVWTYNFNGLAHDLSAYGLCYQSRTVEKYIPDEYFTASLEQRLRLLAGLIDTDGYQYQEDGRYYFVTAGRKLRDGFERLISTFGWKVSLVEHQPTTSSSGIVGKHVYWTIGFSPTFDIPCVLERKRPTRFAKQKRTGIVSIEHTPPCEGNCITVEGGLYCVGQHLVTTHNSWLVSRIALLSAYAGTRVNIAAATGDGTDIIMRHGMSAAAEAADEIKNALTAETLKRVDKLDQSMSKTRLSFPGRGSLQGLSLGDTFADVSKSKAVGRGGAYFVDEAANISSASMAEIGRREFSQLNGRKEPLVMISNPHRPGYFYDFITKDDLKDRECVIWSDALTACQEGRWTAQSVLESDFAEHADTLQRYLLCELPNQGTGMFDELKVRTEPTTYEGYTTRVLGIDAAYKGKDDIQVCLCDIEGDRVYFNAVEQIRKKKWIDGVTSKEIVEQIARTYHKLGCVMACVDIGFGVWLVEGLVQHGVNAVGVNFGAGPTKWRILARHYSAVEAQNLRAEMHLDLKDVVEHQVAEFSPQVYEQIKEVLPFVVSERKTNNKIIVVPKPEIKAKIGHSPDAFDAVLLALHAAVLYSEENISYMTG